MSTQLTPHRGRLGDAGTAFLADLRDTLLADRAGPHGPLPPLLVSMTLVTGLVDAFSYLVLGHVFVANMTGNVVFLGFALAGAPGFSITASLAAMAAFAVGALIGGRLSHRHRSHRGRLHSTAAAAQAAFLAAGVILDSLAYWQNAMGVDGFRFDLAPVLGNGCGSGCFSFDPSRIITTIAFRARPSAGGSGVDLVAEPWTAGDNGYEVGQFPPGWSEWNDHIRDEIREDQNEVGYVSVTPSELATRISGSPDLYSARTPAA